MILRRVSNFSQLMLKVFCTSQWSEHVIVPNYGKPEKRLKHFQTSWLIGGIHYALTVPINENRIDRKPLQSVSIASELSYQTTSWLLWKKFYLLNQKWSMVLLRDQWSSCWKSTCQGAAQLFRSETHSSRCFKVPNHHLFDVSLLAWVPPHPDVA